MKTRVISLLSLSFVATLLVPHMANAQQEPGPASPPPHVVAEPPALSVAPVEAPAAADPTPRVDGPSVTVLGPTEEIKDQPVAGASEKKESKLPFRNSTFLFDQSISTQTAHLETSPEQSYVPFYEWWLSFRPRWYFTDKISARFRFDYFKEFTNSEQTTKYRADVFGDIWTDLVYATPVPAISKNLKVSAGLRALWPTSKESQANGIYVTTGLTTNANYTIPINGDGAKVFNDAHVAVSLAYSHPFSRATTPTDSSFEYTRQDTEGRSFISDQVRSGTLVAHQFLSVLDTGVTITPKLSLTLDMILINKWHYAPKDSQIVPISGGEAVVPRAVNDQQHSVDTWFIASVDYELFDELTIGLGYYNLANELAPNGERRGLVGGDNIWWSPDARVFFDMTANLDKIYDRVTGLKETPAAPKPTQRARLDPSRLGAF